jgi:hypothetical protein
VSKTEANISVYEFCDDYSFELSNSGVELSNLEGQLSKSDEQLSSKSGHNSTIDTTYNSTKDITITKVDFIKPGRKDSSGWIHKNLLEL